VLCILTWPDRQFRGTALLYYKGPRRQDLDKVRVLKESEKVEEIPHAGGETSPPLAQHAQN